MADGDRYVELWAATNGLTVFYDWRGLFDSYCKETYSKYLYIQQGAGNVVARFVMSQRDADTAFFTYYDGPYKGSYMGNSGGYLYTKSESDYLGTEYPDGWTGGTVKLYTVASDMSKQWFTRGSKYESKDCGPYYYLQTTSNYGDALAFQLKDFNP